MQPNPRSLSKVVALLVCLPALAQAAERLRVEPGTKIPVRLERSVGTKDFYEWHSFGGVRTVTGTLMQDIATSDGQVAPAGGHEDQYSGIESKRAGRVEGRSQLRLGLYSVLTPNGERIPLDGYANQLTRHKKTDKEGTAHGNRGLVKDAGVDFSAVAIGADRLCSSRAGGWRLGRRRRFAGGSDLDRQRAAAPTSWSRPVP